VNAGSRLQCTGELKCVQVYINLHAFQLDSALAVSRRIGRRPTAFTVVIRSKSQRFRDSRNATDAMDAPKAQLKSPCYVLALAPPPQIASEVTEIGKISVVMHVSD